MRYIKASEMDKKKTETTLNAAENVLKFLKGKEND